MWCQRGSSFMSPVVVLMCRKHSCAWHPWIDLLRSLFTRWNKTLICLFIVIWNWNKNCFVLVEVCSSVHVPRQGTKEKFEQATLNPDTSSSYWLMACDGPYWPDWLMPQLQRAFITTLAADRKVSLYLLGLHLYLRDTLVITISGGQTIVLLNHGLI